MIFSSRIPIERTPRALATVVENKIVIDSVDRASGENMTVEVTKENIHIEDHQNVLEARNLDGVFSKQED